jgi:glycosyltransferase involved in cell wall biosynthesis
MPELITDGVSGRLVPFGNADALAQALRQVLDDPAGAGAYAEAACAGLRRNFSPRQMLGRLLDLYLAASRDS